MFWMKSSSACEKWYGHCVTSLYSNGCQPSYHFNVIFRLGRMYYRGQQGGVISEERSPSVGKHPPDWPQPLASLCVWILILQTFILHFITSPSLNAGTPSPPRTLSSVITLPFKKQFDLSGKKPQCPHDSAFVLTAFQLSQPVDTWN